MVYEYDTDVDALYIKLKDQGLIDKQLETEDGTIIDVDNHGRPIGLEIISPGTMWSIDTIEKRVKLTASEKKYVSTLLTIFLERRSNNKSGISDKSSYTAPSHSTYEVKSA